MRIRKEKKNSLVLYQSIGLHHMTNWHRKHYGILIVPCINLIYFVILPAGIQFIGRK